MFNRHHQYRSIEVGSDDMTLLREVRRTTHYIVATLLDLGNKSRAIVGHGDVHTVAYGYGIGTADASQAKLTLHLAIDHRTIYGLYGVPATGTSYYYALCHL
jgi:hypothetical protein